MTIAPILEDLKGLDRLPMIARLKIERDSANLRRRDQVEQKDSEIDTYIDKLEGILLVLLTGTVPSSLTKGELQELEPILERFVRAGDFDESTYELLKSQYRGS
jgi:hypothetical protein